LVKSENSKMKTKFKVIKDQTSGGKSGIIHQTKKMKPSHLGKKKGVVKPRTHFLKL